jgi:hypothetical protein
MKINFNFLNIYFGKSNKFFHRIYIQFLESLVLLLSTCIDVFLSRGVIVLLVLVICPSNLWLNFLSLLLS